MAGIHQRHLEPFVGERLGFHETVIDEVGYRGDAGARRISTDSRRRNSRARLRPATITGIDDQRREAGELAGERRQAADAERVEPPQRVHQGNGDEAGRDHRPAQIGEDREQERGGVAIDHHQVDEVRRHLHDVVLQPRQQHQHHDQRQRQRTRQRRAPHQRDEEEVQDPPGQQKADARAEIGLGLDHDRECRQMRRCNSQQPPDADRGNARQQAWRRGSEGWARAPWAGRKTLPGAMRWALAGDDQETHDAAGTCAMSQNRN